MNWKTYFLIIILTGMAYTGWAQDSSIQTVKGVVYEDVNQSRKRDSREKGIPDVPVSNGKEVVLTDKEGRYELPISDDQQVFVIKPTDYSFLLDDNNLPQFYYTHKPEGSPDSQFKGVSPTGQLPKSLDFGLISKPENRDFSVLLFGDPQPHVKEHVEFFDRRIVNELVAVEDVVFGMSLGDVMDNDLSMYDLYKAAIKRIGIPWLQVMGNHDLNFDAPTDVLSDETFESHFGPTNLALNYGGVHFLLLDDILYPDPRDGQGYWGGLREDQFEFIENNLQYVSPDAFVVVGMHIPPWDEGTFRPADKQRLFSLLQGFRQVLLVTAHSHVQRNLFYGEESGWNGQNQLHELNIGTTSGSFYSGPLDEQGIPQALMVDGTPPGYGFLTVKDGTYVLDYKVAGKPADYRMHIVNPKVVVQNRHTPADILVNFYMGSDQDTLSYKIGDGDWVVMTKHLRVDPLYSDYIFQWNQSTEPKYSRWPDDGQPSTHIWSSRIPSNLLVGNHKITVKVQDRYGRTFFDESSFEIVAPRAAYP